MLLTERLDAILGLLTGLATTVEPYQGQLETAIKQPSHGLPALLVSFGGFEFDTAQNPGENPPVPNSEIWRVAIVTSNQGGSKAGQRQALGLINATIKTLSSYEFTPGERLWPVSADLAELATTLTVFMLYFVIDDIEDIDRD